MRDSGGTIARLLTPVKYGGRYHAREFNRSPKIETAMRFEVLPMPEFGQPLNLLFQAIGESNQSCTRVWRKKTPNHTHRTLGGILRHAIMIAGVNVAPAFKPSGLQEVLNTLQSHKLAPGIVAAPFCVFASNKGAIHQLAARLAEQRTLWPGGVPPYGLVLALIRDHGTCRARPVARRKEYWSVEQTIGCPGRILTATSRLAWQPTRAGRNPNAVMAAEMRGLSA